MDAKQALGTVRAGAATNGIGSNRIGMWGFSADGHLTALLGTQFDGGDRDATDPTDKVSSRPDFLILSYALITFSASGATHAGSTSSLLGDSPTAEQRDAVSDELHVTTETPPSFLFATTDDQTVPVTNCVLFYRSLIEHHVAEELHLFQHGLHGAALAKNDPELSLWTTLLLHWLAANKWDSTTLANP